MNLAMITLAMPMRSHERLSRRQGGTPGGPPGGGGITGNEGAGEKRRGEKTKRHGAHRNTRNSMLPGI